MSLQTIVLSYANQADASTEQLHSAHRIAINAALAFERITAGWSPLPVRAPLAVRDDSRPLPYSGKISENAGMWAEVAQTLSLQGHDPSEALYAVWVLGQPGDWSGLGQPVWAEGQPWGWNDAANPRDGGLAVIGQAPLDRVAEIPEPPRRTAVPSARAVVGPGLVLEEYFSVKRYYSKTVREKYHRQIHLAVHEIGHAAGCQHTGYDQTNHPNGRPNDPTMKRSSVMAYGWSDYSVGRMETVGAFEGEIDVWRRSVHFGVGEQRYKALFQSDVAIIV